MAMKTNPCPWCGDPSYPFEGDKNDWWVRCAYSKCGATGPIEPDEAHAIAAWNRVAKAKEEQPTAPSGQGD